MLKSVRLLLEENRTRHKHFKLITMLDFYMEI